MANSRAPPSATLATWRSPSGPQDARTDRQAGQPEENAPLYGSARALAAKTRPRQIAALKVVEAIEGAAAAALPDEGRRRERELFVECVTGEQAKALIHVFFAGAAAAKVRDLPKDHAPRQIASVAPSAPERWAAESRWRAPTPAWRVTIKDASQQALDTGPATINALRHRTVKRGRLDKAAAERLARIAPRLSAGGVATADVIIEAVFESLSNT